MCGGRGSSVAERSPHLDSGTRQNHNYLESEQLYNPIILVLYNVLACIVYYTYVKYITFIIFFKYLVQWIIKLS